MFNRCDAFFYSPQVETVDCPLGFFDFDFTPGDARTTGDVSPNISGT